MSNPYVKSVRHLDEIDIYQIGNLYEVKSHAVFHALKKLLCAGKRGAKDYEQDLMEAIESIERELQIICEDEDRVERGPHDHTLSMVGAAGRMRRKFKREVVDAPGGTQDCGFSPTFHDPGFDEQRMDAIGQNGNEGEHYEPDMSLDEVLKAALPEELVNAFVTDGKEDWRVQVDWSMASPHHQYAYLGDGGRIKFCMHRPPIRDYVHRETETMEQFKTSDGWFYNKGEMPVVAGTIIEVFRRNGNQSFTKAQPQGWELNRHENDIIGWRFVA